VLVDGAPLVVDTRKATALLAVLAIDGPTSRETLADRLWPESDEPHARGALRRTMSVLGSALGSRWLEADRRTLHLDATDRWVDVEAFTSGIAQVASHDHPSVAACDDCVASLRAVVDLRQGELLAGFVLRDSEGFEDWRRLHDERIRRDLCGTLERLTRAEAERGELGAALEHANRWLELDPLGEPVHVRLMLLHAWRGERAEAIRRYRECAAVLDRELGVRPLARTTALYQAIVEGRVQRPQPSLPPAAPTGPTAVRPVVTRGELPLVGRGDALALGLEHLAAAPGRVLTVEGEAGIGKTRYVDELEAALHRRGVPVVVARCHPGERGLALGPVIELLRAATRMEGADERVAELALHVRSEAGRLLPSLADDVAVPPPVALDSPGAHALFLDATAVTLATLPARQGRRPVLVLEDVQHADDGTIDLLTYVVRRLATYRVGVVLTWRSRTVLPADQLLRALADPDVTASREAIELERLTRDELALLLRAGPASKIGEKRFERLVEESEGLPLAVVEYLRVMDDTHADDGEAWPIPSGLRELLAGRLVDLSETALQLTTAASVLGHDIDQELLVHTGGRSEDETVAALEELLERGILRATETGTYDFSHEKIATVAYERASPVRRRLLHARAATALAARTSRREGGVVAAIVAEHARLGGDPETAARWHLRAGDHAVTVFANGEARTHYERALELDHPDPSAVHRRLARLQVLAGEYASALERYETAAALASDEVTLGHVEHELGRLHLRRGWWGAARGHLEAALETVGAEDPATRARIVADLGLVELRSGSLGAASDRAKGALELAELAGDREAIAQARNLAGLLARQDDRIADAQRHLEHAAALARSLPDPSAYIAVLNNLALTTADAGDDERARELLEAAIVRCSQQGDHHRRAALHNNLADLLHRLDRDDEAMEHLKQAVTLFAEVGSAGEPDPEIWKLVDW
jgi:DNA-binding SARP family transcriptional activator/tetratricopeptide (TPR) repeat protein